MDFTLIILSQYPLFFLLSLASLFKYLRVRKRSAVKSIAYVILFGVLLAACVASIFLGVQMKYWSLATLAVLNVWSWAGLILLLLVFVLIIAHSIEAHLNRRKLEKAMKQAEKVKDAEVRRAREEAANEERERMQKESTAEKAGEDDSLPTDVLKEFL
ncbi:MAG: hypothetical protein IKD01_04100 [Oscillospiraceae bacterium]|nr:hypothetical protein [Oscillospiraceae bacterium]